MPDRDPSLSVSVERATVQAIVEKLRNPPSIYSDPAREFFASAADFVAREFLPSPGSEEEK